jgi:hypothetical protein
VAVVEALSTSHFKIWCASVFHIDRLHIQITDRVECDNLVVDRENEELRKIVAFGKPYLMIGGMGIGSASFDWMRFI